jgi:hypothetical protein
MEKTGVLMTSERYRYRCANVYSRIDIQKNISSMSCIKCFLLYSAILIRGLLFELLFAVCFHKPAIAAAI